MTLDDYVILDTHLVTPVDLGRPGCPATIMGTEAFGFEFRPPLPVLHEKPLIVLVLMEKP